MENYYGIYTKFKSLTFDLLINEVYNENNEAIWMADKKTDFSEADIENLKNANLENIIKLKSNKKLSGIFEELKTPFSEIQINQKCNHLSEIIMKSFGHISFEPSDFNILNFTWDFHLKSSLSIFLDPKHDSKNKVGYMDFGTNIQWIPIEIQIEDYFGSYIQFEEEDEKYLLMESEIIMLLLKALKLQFYSILKSSLKLNLKGKIFKEKFYYATEFDTDSTLLLKSS